MTTKTVTAASLTDDVVTLTLSDVSGLEAGYPVSVGGIGSPFDGNHTLTAVDDVELTVTYAKNHANVAEADVTGILVVLVHWIQDSDVIGFLGVEPATEDDEDYLSTCTDAANEWAYRRRASAGYSDLPNAVPGPDAKLGTILYAASLYRERGSIDSYQSFQELPTIAPVGSMGQILRLLGLNRPQVA